jgi:hypothetical protein
MSASMFWSGVYHQPQRPAEELRRLQQGEYSAPQGADPRLLQGAIDAFNFAESKKRRSKRNAHRLSSRLAFRSIRAPSPRRSCNDFADEPQRTTELNLLPIRE